MWVASGAVGDSYASKLCKERGLQARVMWLDAEANLWELSTRQGVAETVRRCKQAGINTIVVDVKPLSGLVLYKSKFSPRLVQFDGKEYPANYDLLATVADEGHKAGIPVHAAINVFSEGSKKLGGGMALKHTDWQCVEYGIEQPRTPGDGSSGELKTTATKVMRRVGDGQAEHNAVFVNPLHPEARAYALSVIREICEKYPIDGIIFDRLRYPNIYSDFSDLTRTVFEKYIGRSVAEWPEDVLTRAACVGTEDVRETSEQPDDDVIRGPLFKDWLKFRAGVIRDFVAEAREVVKSTRPSARVGIYVGSWYPIYYGVGVNWASPNHVTDLEWWPDGYQETGYADLVDYMCTGCYYPNPTRKDSVDRGAEDWASVEAAAEESANAVKDETFVYGSLYLFQYHTKPADFEASIRQCLKLTQGCMLFDLVYVRKYDWWDILKRCFAAPARAPHELPGLVTRLRAHGDAHASR